MEAGCILFVDADPDLLSGTVAPLRDARPDWTLSVARSWSEVLQAVARHPIDVVVADVRLPGMEAASLLAEVTDVFPKAGRIVHTAQPRTGSLVRTVPLAHQLLPKPCPTDVLVRAIERTTALRHRAQNPAVERALGRLGSLPALPRVYVQLQEVLADPRASSRRVAGLVEQDIGVAGKVLQLVNSAYVGLPRRVSAIQDAVTILGMRTVSDLVLLLEVFTAFTPERPVAGVTVRHLQEQSLRVATGARRIATRLHADDTYTAGLLHDLGRILLASRMPDAWEDAVLEADRAGRDARLAEQAHLGFTRDDVAAYVLDLWGMPTSVCEAVAFHDAPAALPHTTFEPVDAVHVARALVDARDQTDGVELDVDHLRALGVLDQVHDWTTLVP